MMSVTRLRDLEDVRGLPFAGARLFWSDEEEVFEFRRHLSQTGEVTADQTNGYIGEIVFDFEQDIAAFSFRAETVAIDADGETWGIDFGQTPPNIFVDQHFYSSDIGPLAGPLGSTPIPASIGPFNHAADGSVGFAGYNPPTLPVTIGDYAVWGGISARFLIYRIGLMQRAGSDIAYDGAHLPSLTQTVTISYL